MVVLRAEQEDNNLGEVLRHRMAGVVVVGAVVLELQRLERERKV